MNAVWPVVIAAALAFGAYAAKRLDEAAQPLRIELATKAQDFLAAPNLSEATKSYVCFLLDTAFGMRGTILLSFLLVPLVALAVLIFPRSWRKIS